MTDIAELEAELLADIAAASPGPYFYDGFDLHDAGTWLIAVAAREGNPSTKSDPKATARLLALAPSLAGAVGLARSLRGQGSELEGNQWHLKDCGAARDWVHFQEVTECDRSCDEASELLADWEKLLRGRNA